MSALSRLKDNQGDGVEPMTEPTWQDLLKSALNAEEDEIDCQECYELLDEYADLMLEGAAPCKVMHVVKQHLDNCPDCASVFDCLISILGAGDQPWPCNPSI